MCLRKIFGLDNPNHIPTTPETPETPESGKRKRYALLFGINDYKGDSNDLRGCLNDLDDVEAKLKAEFPDFIIKKFKDSQVTRSTFKSEIRAILAIMKPGDFLLIYYSGHGTQVINKTEENGYDEALYLYDGVFVDDDIQGLQAMTPDGAHVTAKFDSCFSANMLRNLTNPEYRKSKFLQTEGVPLMQKVVSKLGKDTHKADSEHKWIVISGCEEEQTSADAVFNGRYNGAFTYYDLKSFKADTTYKEEVALCHAMLHKDGFTQNPELSGNESLFDTKVFI